MIMVQTHNFTLSQDIIVFNANNEIITRTKATMKNLPEIITQLAETHQEYDVKLLGNKKFNANMVDKIKLCYIAKYNRDRLNVQIV